jgi:membrane protein
MKPMMEIKRKVDYVAFIARESITSFLRDEGFEKASVLAYNSFFALFPLVLLLLFIAGHFMASSQMAMEGVERLAAQLMPMFGDVVIREVQGLAFQKAWGLVSLLLLFWGVTPLASAIRRAFGQIYQTQSAIPFLKGKMKDALAVLMMLLLLILLVVGEIAYAVVGSLVAGVAGKIPFLVRLTDFIIPIMVAVVFLGIVHYVFAPKRPRLLPVLVGSLVTALLLALMGPLFTTIMRFNPDYGFAFGSLKAVFFLLVWVYSAFVAILAGVEVSATIQRRDVLLVRELLTAPAKRVRNVARMDRYVETLDPGQVIFTEGESGDTMYYVVSGTVTLSRASQTLRVMKTGEYFGEMAMLLTAPRSATATASEPDTRVLAISAANLQDVLNQNPQIVLSLLREMAERLRLANDRALSPSPPH